MRRSTDHIVVSQQGILPRPEPLRDAFLGGDATRGEFEAQLPAAIAGVVRRQAEIGIESLNDGEYSKPSFLGYVRDRMTGITQRERPEGAPPRNAGVNGRDRRAFPGFYEAGLGRFYFGNQPVPTGTMGGGPPGRMTTVCVEPLTYVGADAARIDIDRLLGACEGLDVEPYLPAVSPANVEHWLENDHYPDDEAFLFAIADCLNKEYRQITEAGVVVQVDDPDLPDGWQHFPDMSVEEYRKYAQLRVDALNHALRDVPEDMVRLHICWGSQHGPHRDDIPLRDIVDLMLQVKAQCYSIEHANPRHEHEWELWKDVKLPDGKMLMPGVVGHSSNHVEHSELVAQRLKRFASVVGRENVLAGTDCGLGNKVGHAEIAWAKLEELVRGAELASKDLWP